MEYICLTLMICIGALASYTRRLTNPTNASREAVISAGEFTIQPSAEGVYAALRKQPPLMSFDIMLEREADSKR